MIAIRPTRAAWIDRAVADLPTILLDHAHCERKPAHTALKLMARYSDRPRLQMQLSRLAREELVHFERVLRELDLRGLTFGPLSSGAYAATLFKEIAAPGEELLCSALVDRGGDVPVPPHSAEPSEAPPTARCSRAFRSSVL